MVGRVVPVLQGLCVVRPAGRGRSSGRDRWSAPVRAAASRSPRLDTSLTAGSGSDGRTCRRTTRRRRRCGSSGATGSPVSCVASCLMALLEAWPGLADTIGRPELVAAAMSMDVAICAATSMPRIDSTLSGPRPTASSARLSSRCRCPRAMLSISRVSMATLTFFRVGTSRVAITTHSSVSSSAVSVCSSKAGAVSTTTKSKTSRNPRGSGRPAPATPGRARRGGSAPPAP